MHILFLSDNFPPEVNAPASRTHEHARQWVADGHRVTVVTGAPNFPAGRVFDGYRNAWHHEETIDGIRVVRVWSYIASNEGFARRIVDYLSYAATATWAARRVETPDVVVATSPQLFTACAGAAVARIHRRPWVFELRDLWPESIKAVGAMRESAAIRLLERLEMALYRDAARIVSVTESFRDTLARRGIDAAKIDVVTNGVDLSRFAPRPKDEALQRELGLAGCFVAGYIGTHGMAHGLETLLDAARIVAADPRGADVRLLLLGDGARKAALREKAAAMELRNVLFVDTVAKSEVARYWSLLDASIIHLRRSELFTTVIPSKLFECMGMGVPVLHGVEGESARIVEREGCGETFPPDDAAALAVRLLAWRADAGRLDAMRVRALKAAPRHDRTGLARRMAAILEDVARRGRPTAAG